MSTIVLCQPHHDPANYVVRAFYGGAAGIMKPACRRCVDDELDVLDNFLGPYPFSVAHMPVCGNCRTPLVTRVRAVKAGRPAEWCSDSCRKGGATIHRPRPVLIGSHASA